MLHFLNGGIQDIIHQVDVDKKFVTFQDFKADYLRVVYQFGEAFRNKYHIKKMDIVEKLEQELGFQLEKVKDFKSSKLSYSKIDVLDRKMYDLFLKIKSEFNKFSPINKDKKVMNLIAETINTLV